MSHVGRRGELRGSWRTLGNLSRNELIDAVAFAGPTHLMDGWSYLARSLSAAMAGDAHAVRHLAYYAQLRAGLSILASMGVGVFNGLNFVVDSRRRVLRLDEDPRSSTNYGAGTHQIVWMALDSWARGGKAGLFLQSMRVRGVPLEDCLVALWPGFSATTSALDAIRSWGLDLNRGQSEHGFRKVSSYAPHDLNRLPHSVSGALQFIANLWEMLEPSGTGQFDRLDRFLLRAIMWRYHNAVQPNLAYQVGAIGNRYAELPEAIKSLVPKNFLLGVVEPREPPLLLAARSTRNPALPMDMVARATLLLRTATGFVQSNLVDAGINIANGELRPWVDEVAVDRGFWNPADPLTDPTDLWADVSVGLTELAASLQSPPACFYDWASVKARGVPVLSESERIGVWTLGA